MTTPNRTAATAIVTGASRGLGRALAGGLAGAGWRLVIDARTATDLADARAELTAGGAEVVAVPGDVTDPAHREELHAAAAAAGGANLLVLNAGALGPSPLPPLAELRTADLQAVLEANLVAPLALARLVLPQLRARRGAVLAVTSDAAVEPYPGWGAYGASKAGLEQAIAVLGAEEPDLTVWRVDPGDLRTRMHQDAFPGADISDRPPPATVVPALLRLVTERLPSGRYRAADLRSVPAHA